jgi:hypothetical protein
VHAWVAGKTGLSIDEAHYALYGLHPDWSYFDHPPLVGWVQWLVLHGLGSSDFALRLPAMLAWLATAYLAIDLFNRVHSGQETHPQKNSRIHPIAWIWLATPLPHLLGIALIPDTLLMPLTLLVMGQTHRLITASEPATQRPHRGPWLMLGLYLGLAGLTKYSAVFLALGVLIALQRAYGWSVLRHSGLWLAGGVALLGISPVLIWNIEHHGISLIYQFEHAHLGLSPEQTSHPLMHAFMDSGYQLLRFGLLVILVYGPAHLLLLRRCPRPNPWRWTWAFSLPLGLVLLYTATHAQPLPHWWMPVLVAALPSLAWRFIQMEPRQQMGILIAYGVHISASLALCVAMVMGGWAESPKASANPLADLHGWPEAAAQAMAQAQAQGATTMAVSHWTLASRLAWYAHPWPVKVLDLHPDQFTLWFGPLQPHEKAVWVNFSRMPFPPPLQTEPANWSRCDTLTSLPTQVWKRAVSHFDFSICQ